MNTFIKTNTVELHYLEENNGVYKTILFHSASWPCPVTLEVSGDCPLLSMLLAGICDCMKSLTGENCKSEFKALCGVWRSSRVTLLCCTFGFPWFQPPSGYICIVLVTKYLFKCKCPILFTQRTSSSLWPCGPDLELTSDADLPAVGHPSPPGPLIVGLSLASLSFPLVL